MPLEQIHQLFDVARPNFGFYEFLVHYGIIEKKLHSEGRLIFIQFIGCYNHELVL